MTKARLFTRASVCALAFLLAGCGGGGGGGPISTPAPVPTPSPTPGPTPSPSPTPTPTPTSGANDDLLAPLASDSFTVRSARATLSVPLSGANVTTTAAASTMRIGYDASTQTYTVTSGTTTQSFRPSDVDAAQSSPLLTTYVRTSGNTTDNLSLTRPGTGAGQTRYVAGAFWQRQVNGTSAITGSFDAATFGIETSNAATPRSGAASYDVTLLGLRSFSTLLYGVAGDGRINVDFASGAMNGGGSYSETETQSGATASGYGWAMYGLVGSGTNDFAGKINLNGFATLTGSFYGPAAAELGATYYARPNSEQALAGLLLGKRGSYPVNSGTRLPLVEADTFFAPLSAGLSATLNGSNQVTAHAASADLVSVLLTQDGAQEVTYSADGRIGFPNTGPLTKLTLGNYLTYMRGGEQLDGQSGGNFYDAYLYGFKTAGASMPGSGNGLFNVSLRGAVATTGAPLRSVLGDGTLTANFATGALITSGNYEVHNVGPATVTEGGMVGLTPADAGSWSGNATIGSGTSAFAGTITLAGGTTYSGALAGQFYGPTANEVGAKAELTGGSARLSAVLYGFKNAEASLAFSPLADLPGQTKLPSYDTEILYDFNAFNNANSQPGGNTLTQGNYTYDLYYDPTSTAERLRITYENYYDTVLATGGSANLSAAASTASYNAYTGTLTGGPYIGNGTYELRDYVFDGQGGRIELSYTGFAAYYTEGNVSFISSDDYRRRYGATFLPYGNFTPSRMLPRTGTGSYTGVAMGRGGIYGGTNTTYYDVNGTGTLNANFATLALTATLNLSGREVGGAGTQNFGPISFAGNIDGFDPVSGAGTASNFFFVMPNSAGATGEFMGRFHGPNAEEVGAVFEVELGSGSGVSGFVEGGFVGKR